MRRSVRTRLLRDRTAARRPGRPRQVAAVLYVLKNAPLRDTRSSAVMGERGLARRREGVLAPAGSRRPRSRWPRSNRSTRSGSMGGCPSASQHDGLVRGSSCSPTPERRVRQTVRIERVCSAMSSSTYQSGASKGVSRRHAPYRSSLRIPTGLHLPAGHLQLRIRGGVRPRPLRSGGLGAIPPGHPTLVAAFSPALWRILSATSSRSGALKVVESGSQPMSLHGMTESR